MNRLQEMLIHPFTITSIEAPALISANVLHRSECLGRGSLRAKLVLRLLRWQIITAAPRAVREQPLARILVTILCCEPFPRGGTFVQQPPRPAGPSAAYRPPMGGRFGRVPWRGPGRRRGRDVHGGCRELPQAGQVGQGTGTAPRSAGAGRGCWRGRPG